MVERLLQVLLYRQSLRAALARAVLKRCDFLPYEARLMGDAVERPLCSMRRDWHRALAFRRLACLNSAVPGGMVC